MLKSAKLKKIVASVLCVGMLGVHITAMAVADGNTYVDANFDQDISDIVAGGWIKMDAGGETSAGGTLHCQANGNTGSQGLKYNIALPTQYVATFRIKANNLTGNGRFQPIIYENGTRVFLQIYASKIQLRADSGFQSISKSTEMGVWYTYTVAVNNGIATVSRQKDGDSSPEVLYEDFALQAGTGAYMTYAVEGHGGNDAELDDLKIWTGMSMSDTKFTLDDATIESFESDGVLKASTDIYYCDNDNEGDIDTTLMMIVFDRYGKIVDLGISRETVEKNGMTTVEVSVDLTGVNATGGFAEVYLWDSIRDMNPLADAIVLE